MAKTGGFEALIFTRGIGAHAAPVRRMVCGRPGWLGVQIGEQANEDGASASIRRKVLSRSGSCRPTRS